MRTAILTMLLCFAFVPEASAASSGGGVTGTYKMKGGEVRVREANGKIKFFVSAAYEANVGEVAGEAPLQGGAAAYADPDNDCALAFKFSGETLSLAQDGTCGMGLNVTGDGIYKRTSKAAPAFDE